jgi:hypothetical protein
MGLISTVTSLTPDMVSVSTDNDGITIHIDRLAVFVGGDTKAERLAVLNAVGHKLLNAHDAIAAQARLFDAEVGG